MPELPEVEVVRLFLESKLQDKTIKNIEILNPKSFIGDANDALGQKLVFFARQGKQLSLHLGNGLLLLFHLKMTGQVIFIDKSKTVLGHPTKDSQDQLPNKATRVVFTFSDNSHLYFNDQRKFGWIRLFTQDLLVNFQSKLGVDIFDPLFTVDYFYQQLHKTSRPIKLALLDQEKFAGIGNIYANDGLFLARIHPLTPANKITRFEAETLHRYLIKIMKESVLHGGSTAKDNGYIKPDGQYGEHQFHFQVYQKTGEPCPVCGGLIERLKLGGRSAFFCPQCQKQK